ncbi:hypothetical protein GCM10027600_41130 [Nocardioides ginsengisegetis]
MGFMHELPGGVVGAPEMLRSDWGVSGFHPDLTPATRGTGVQKRAVHKGEAGGPLRSHPMGCGQPTRRNAVTSPARSNVTCMRTSSSWPVRAQNV